MFEDKETKKELVKVTATAPQKAMELAEIESQIATAKTYPRDIKVFKEKLMSMANLDQETAEGCYYALPRGGKAIDGPSIRLAEIALSCYGNCVAEADVLTEDDKFIYAMGQCRDLENNIAVRVKVRRRITYKDGKRFNDDMIAVTANAACAIALRNAIFKIVPGAYLKPVFDKCKKTAVGEVESLANRRAEVIKRIKQFGVNTERILKVLDRKSVDEVTFDDVAILIGLGTAIKDGDTTVEEAFPPDFKTVQKESQKAIKNKAGSDPVDTTFKEADPTPAKKKTKKVLAAETKKLKQAEDATKAKKAEVLQERFVCGDCGQKHPETDANGHCLHCHSRKVTDTTIKEPEFLKD